MRQLELPEIPDFEVFIIGPEELPHFLFVFRHCWLAIYLCLSHPITFVLLFHLWHQFILFFNWDSVWAVDTFDNLVLLLNWKLNTLNLLVFGIVDTSLIEPLKDLCVVLFISAASKHWINNKMLSSFILDITVRKYAIQHHLEHFSVTLFKNFERYKWLDCMRNDRSHGVWINIRCSLLHQLCLADLKNLCSRNSILFQHISQNIVELLSWHAWFNLLQIWLEDSQWFLINYEFSTYACV